MKPARFHEEGSDDRAADEQPASVSPEQETSADVDRAEIKDEGGDEESSSEAENA